MYLIRLDDACEYMDTNRWAKMESILDDYCVKPIVGVIPKCKDKEFISNYDYCERFWDKTILWRDKEWSIALHGCDHVYTTNKGGINPVCKKSEFAEVAIEIQKAKIKEGIEILSRYGLHPSVFFAPSHTFDRNTIKALLECSDIRIINDTYATDLYKEKEMFYIPIRRTSRYFKGLQDKIRLSTCVYHPNTMNEEAFSAFIRFIKTHRKEIISMRDVRLFNRRRTMLDKLYSTAIISHIKIARLINISQ